MEFQKMMTLVFLRTLHSLPLVYAGLRTSNLSVAFTGFVVVAVVFLLAVFMGFEYVPIHDFRPIFNLRAFATMMILAGTYYHVSFLKQYGLQFSWYKNVYGVL